MKRKLKIYYLNRIYGVKKPCPMIRISGKYLASFGFNTGDEIELEFETDRIAIRKVTEVIREKELKEIRAQKGQEQERKLDRKL